MEASVEIEGRPVAIEISAAASRALANRQTPLLAELELYFSCLIRKKVRFREAGHETGEVAAGNNLTVRFRPVMTAQCKVHEVGENEVPVSDFPIANPRPFVPHWLHIDYKRGEFVGEFGYTH